MSWAAGVETLELLDDWLVLDDDDELLLELDEDELLLELDDWLVLDDDDELLELDDDELLELDDWLVLDDDDELLELDEDDELLLELDEDDPLGTTAGPTGIIMRGWEAGLVPSKVPESPEIGSRGSLMRSGAQTSPAR